ncbi:MAG: AEC family transporter [Proteobacteria bacterium]|nr:AEC family transporter [Pseudomonadota bacterium]
MEALFYHVSNVLLPVLICVLAGYGLARFNVYFDTKMVGSLVSNIGYPTLILSHLSGQHIEFEAFIRVMAASIAMIACFGLIAFIFLKVIKLPVQAFLSPMMLNNVGNIGLPVSFLAFGNSGLSVSLAVVIIVLIGVFSVGIWVPIGKISFKDLIRQPVIYSVIIALVLLATNTTLPVPLTKSFTILGGLAIPLMLLTLGFTLATLNTGGLLKGFLLALFHLTMTVTVAYVLSHLFQMQGVTRGVFILMCLMPSSVATYLWVEKYQPDNAPTVASMILFSSLLTIAVVPLALTYWI